MISTQSACLSGSLPVATNVEPEAASASKATVENLADLVTLSSPPAEPGAEARDPISVLPEPVSEAALAEWQAFLAPAEAPDELGRLGPYRILKMLGTGGMGVVFQAEDVPLQRLVALKVLLPTLAASPSARQRFLREAQTAAALAHDHIIPIYQVGEHRGLPYLAMPFLEGEPLDCRLRREGRLPLVEVLRIGRETAEGLAAAHERGLVHRDIKPANLWLEGERGRVKIVDFGLALSTTRETRLTQVGAIVGTPAYMAPEQAEGNPVDARADLFSLGCVLYRLSTGELPFKGETTIATLVAVATEPPRPLHRLNPRLPTPLTDLIMQLLAKRPTDRPRSAYAVAEALAAIERDLAPGVSRPRSHPAAARRTVRGQRTVPLPFRGPVVRRATNRGGHRMLVVAVKSLRLIALAWAPCLFFVREPMDQS
jgi:serine/threonine protein kinase